MSRPIQRDALAALADRIEAAAPMAKELGWGVTYDKLRAAAHSIRWQITWERKQQGAPLL